ncbi:hypothetical protein [Peribacillus asahii]|uniref:hypothetical protein n=1 Tax=Peribacillus asahii TaxID=228899 RepID=UPI00207AB89B|nr:hypothetical protein [Peribacillus asahii]USK86178.1 hypothetical protein LIT35_05920 [Peribacillus asahii]
MKNLQFLNFWFEESEGYVEFKFIGKEGVRDRRFVDVADINEELLQRFVNTGFEEKFNVYFSVATRSQRGGGTEEFVQDVPGVWLDIDPKHATMEDAIQIVASLPTPPSAIVSSGNGIHAYFKFDKPYKVVDEKSREKIKSLSARLHKLAKADNTSDLVRVLRLPSSWNVKEESQPKFCELIEFTGVVYSIDDFAYLTDVEISTSMAKVERVVIDSFKAIDLDDLKVPIHIKRLIVEGGEKHHRSEKVFGVTWSMLENGHSPSEVAFVLTNPDWGISEKILERPHQHQLPYIENAINSVLQRISKGENNADVVGTETTEIQEKDGCYYRGEQRLSNFVFQPSERILLDDNEILKGEVIVNDGTKLTILLDYKSLITKKELLTAINSSKVSWLGGDKEIQYLREFLLTKKVIEKIGVNKIGLHDGLFITQERVVNYQGVVNDSKLVYVPKFTSASMDLERSITINMIDNWEQLAKEVLTLLPKINQEEVIYSLIGWHFVSPLAPLVRKIADGGFPQLMMWGTKGSGKTSTAQVFGKLFGNKEIRSCSRPPFSVMREMDLLNAIPLYLDEYRPMNMPREYLNQIKGFALNAYKAAHDSRGLQNQSTVDYQFTAPIVWIGETSFEDPNLMERIVMAKLSPNVFQQNQEYKKMYRELNKLKLSNFFGGYVQWLLAKLESNKFNLAELYSKYRDLIDDGYDLPERVSINIAIILVGLSIFSSLAGEVGLEISIPFDTIINSQVRQLVGEEAKSSLDRLMEHTATMVDSSRDFQSGVDYLFDDSKGELILATKRWFAELRKFCREYNYFGDVVSDSQFRNFLVENSDAKGYVKVSNSAKRTLIIQKRCTIIDAYQLENDLGIPVDTWIK